MVTRARGVLNQAADISIIVMVLEENNCRRLREPRKETTVITKMLMIAIRRRGVIFIDFRQLVLGPFLLPAFYDESLTRLQVLN